MWPYLTAVTDVQQSIILITSKLHNSYLMFNNKKLNYKIWHLEVDPVVSFSVFINTDSIYEVKITNQYNN